MLIVSTELDEVMALGDRIAVMYHGRIVDIVDARDGDPEQLGLLMGGAGGITGSGMVKPAAVTPGAAR